MTKEGAIQQLPLSALLAVGLDQDCAVLGINLSLPVHTFQVLVAINERRGGQ
jgi:hypothetical protein